MIKFKTNEGSLAQEGLINIEAQVLPLQLWEQFQVVGLALIKIYETRLSTVTMT
jgi:hypothetical protein